MVPLILSALLVLKLLTDVFVGPARTERNLARMRADPASRVRFYRAAIVSGWAWGAVAMLVVVAASFTGTETPGWDLPELPTLGMPAGALIAWLLAAWVALAMVIGSFRQRKRMRAGHQPPGRTEIAVLVPRTDRERWFAAALSVTAGVTEEVFYRYALIVLGIKVFHLPALAAVVLSLLLFVGTQAYQRRLGMVSSVAVLGSVFTFLTLLSGSLLPAILLHIAIDLMALLLVPAEPTPQEPKAEPTPQEPEAKPTQREPEAEPAPQDPEAEPAPQEPETEPAPQEPETEPTQREANAQQAPQEADAHPTGAIRGAEATVHPNAAGDGTVPAAGRPMTAEFPAQAAPRIRPPIPAE